MRRLVAASVILVAGLSLARSTAAGETLEILGMAGILGEWELTGTLASGGESKRFSGPVVMKHVGLCTQDGPEIRKGAIEVQLVGASTMRARLIIEGETCSFAGRKSDSYAGVMRCPDKRDVPLRMWLR